MLYCIRFTVLCLIAILSTDIDAKFVSNGEFLFQVQPSDEAVTITSVAVDDPKTPYSYRVPLMMLEYTTPSLNFALIEGYLCFPTVQNFPPPIQFILRAYPIEAVHDSGGLSGGIKNRSGSSDLEIPLGPLQMLYMVHGLTYSTFQYPEKSTASLPFRFDVLGLPGSEVALAIEYDGDVTIWKRKIDFTNPAANQLQSGPLKTLLDSWDKVASCSFEVTDNITLLKEDGQYVVVSGSKLAYLQPLQNKSNRQEIVPEKGSAVASSSYLLEHYKADAETSCTIENLPSGEYSVIIDKPNNESAIMFDDGTSLSISAEAVGTTVSLRLEQIREASEFLKQ